MLSLSAWRHRLAQRPSHYVITFVILLADSKFPWYFKLMLKYCLQLLNGRLKWYEQCYKPIPVPWNLHPLISWHLFNKAPCQNDGEWSAPRPRRSRRYTLDTMLSDPPSRSWHSDKVKNLQPTGTLNPHSPIVQCIQRASRFTKQQPYILPSHFRLRPRCCKWNGHFFSILRSMLISKSSLDLCCTAARTPR
jgi:hypothetical protein